MHLFSINTSTALAALFIFSYNAMVNSSEAYVIDSPAARYPAATGVLPPQSSPLSLEDLLGVVKKERKRPEIESLSWCPQGHNTWRWKGNDINYIEMGDPSKPALLLIHGFGVSSYHFRRNIPELAKDYHVYAFDMLGFGCSSMPLQDYEPEVWRDQTVDFIAEVIGKPTAIAGNSLGGLTALYASSMEKVKPLVTGCILLNAALRFKGHSNLQAFLSRASSSSSSSDVDAPKNEILDKIWGFFQRLVLNASFAHSKTPEAIEKVLRKLYAVSQLHVDDELIESIQHSSRQENAREIYYRVLSKNGPGTNVFADDLLAKLECPLLLCWGTKDPCFKTTSCDKIQALYRKTIRMDINAGHCPHDEAPFETNAAIRYFMATL